MNSALNPLPVAIIGAGPVGLAAAAELATRDIPFVIFEAGGSVGANIRRWAHVRVFSPWRYNIAPAARRLLELAGWTAPDPEALPTGGEIVTRYLEPLAALSVIRPALRLATRVTAVTRAGVDKLKTAGREKLPFILRVETPEGEADIPVRAVIDCSGSVATPNPAGAHGIAARGERAHAGRIAYGMPDVLGAGQKRYAGKRVAVLGSGHSAIGTLLDLLSLRERHPATEVLWLSRRRDLRPAFGGGAADALPARGTLGVRLESAVSAGAIAVIHPFALHAIETGACGTLILSAENGSVSADELVVATGFRPDLAMLAEMRLVLDDALEAPLALAPLIDPNVHSCGTVPPHGARELRQPESGLYIAGMKSYGRAPTFLLATGHEQVRSIVAEIAGDQAAAARVELVLPETGICASDFEVPAGEPSQGCCGGPAKVDASACCVTDELAKAAGQAGCGCAGTRVQPY
jgi:hypothetical protein